MLVATLLLGHVLVSSKPITFVPTDDAWVYPHAGDATTDVYLRVWGSGGDSVASDPADAGNHSYSYLKFDLSSLKVDEKVVSARLILTHVANAGFPKEAMAKTPIEAREVASGWTEKTWSYDMARQIFPRPGRELILGASLATGFAADKEFQIEIPLKGEAFMKLIARKTLALSLTSAIDPSESGRAFVYKIYSRNEEKESRRPRLELTVE